MYKTFSRIAYLFTICSALIFAGCVNDEFDNPPTTGEDPDIEVTSTIQEFKANWYDPASITEVTDSSVISGVVISNDAAGNFFRVLWIEDETGGIELRIDETNLNVDFPEGRRVFVKCNGLFVSDFAGIIQIGGGIEIIDGEESLARINSLVFREKVLPGQSLQFVTPALKTIDALSLDDITTLVTFEDVEFISADAGQPYADGTPNFEQSINRLIRDCNGNQLIVRSSGFSSFADELTPVNNGSITGGLGIFNNDYQLVIRDLDDVNMNNNLCGGGGGSLTIAQLQSDFASGASIAPNGFIKGTVISDLDNGNITGRNMVIQDETAGIVVRFDANHPFTQGQEVEVNVGGQELSDFNGLVQVNNVPLANATGLSNVGDPAPRATTISEILANADAWESTLIELSNVSFSGNSTWEGNITVTDASGSIGMFTRNAATFATDPLPDTADKLVAYVSDFNETQINIRNLNDVDGAGGGGGGCNVTGATTIIELRDGFACGASSVTSGTINGVVISDFANGNTTGRNVMIQDGTAGIVVRFDVDHSFALGNAVQIDVTGQELSEFNSLLQVNNVPISNATDLGPGTMPTPRVATVAEIVANYNTWESTLVEISNATFSGGSTYEGALDVSDGTGSIVHFTRSAASFSGDMIPAGPVTLTCVVTDFNAPNIFIRNLNDVN